MEGSCNCGGVRFEVSGDIHSLYQCHCKLCQRQSGSTSNTATIVQKSTFSWVSGTELISTWKKDTGFTAHFCSRCGSPVPNQLREMDYYWIPMGLVEECDAKVVTHLCCDSMASWDATISGGEQYNDMPSELEGFVKSFSNI